MTPGSDAGRGRLSGGSAHPIIDMERATPPTRRTHLPQRGWQNR
jgi:hypothetical protein